MDRKFSIRELHRRMETNWPEAMANETAFIVGLIRFHDIVALRTREVIARYDLTQAGFEVLVTLRSLPPPRQLTPNDLFRAILITSGGMTKVLHNLESRGWIDRIDHERDRRSRLVRLTEAGERQVETCMEAVKVSDRDLLLEVLEEEEVARLGSVFLAALNKIEDRDPA